jgi:phosphate transport system substrate-binding protein
MGKRGRDRAEVLYALRRASLWMAVAIWVAACAFSRALQPGSPAQASESVRKIFVDAFQGKLGSAQLRNKVIARLRASREVRVVDKESDADLVVHGSGETWLKGYVAINPHPAASVRQPVYGGYLSLEVESRGGAALWSYLVTPGRLHWSGVDADMADHIVRLMLTALNQRNDLAAQSQESAQSQIALSGAGSTFAAPLYQAWIDSFEGRRPEVRTTYQAVGSENGIRLLEEGKVDFAASDVPVSDEQMAAMPVKFNQYATVLGGVVPAYNLAGVGRDLRFTPEILAEIYLGKIKRWNDPRLRSVNGGASLPDEPIVVLHRSDGSGTSFAWTEFLSKANAQWKSEVGSGMRMAWPSGEGVEGNEGVATKVAETPGAIGYMELTYAIRHELSFGLVRNAAGRFVQANLATLNVAAAEASASGDSRASLVNATGKDAYPIATFTWILLPTSAADAKKSAALRDLLRWMLTAGQKECSGLGYVPLPKNLVEKELQQASPGGAGSAESESTSQNLQAGPAAAGRQADRR